MSKKNLESLIDEALENIRNDRKAAREFLNEIAKQVSKPRGRKTYRDALAL